MRNWATWKKRLAGAIAALVVSVPLLLYVLSAGETPSLAFEGVKMVMQTDGSVQLFVEVSIRDVEDSGSLPVGARFSLNYNREYMTLSNYMTNEALGNEASANLAFQYSPDLYQELKSGNWVAEDPFEATTENKNYIDQFGNTYVRMNLTARRNVAANSRGLRSVPVSKGSAEITVIDKEGKIVLGTLSFRIEPENVAKLPEITQNFDGISKAEDPHGTVDSSKYLIWHEVSKAPTWSRGTWSVLTAYEVAGGQYTQGYLDNSDMAAGGTLNSSFGYNLYAISHFTFHFPKIVISAEAAEAELTVDAYQAYTNGTVSDLDVVLQKYSPAVLVKYSDGSQENITFPWGRTTSPWTASKVTKWGDYDTWDAAWAATDATKLITDTNYDCTQGDYRIQKLYCYTNPDDPNDTTVKVFPLPVNVHLTVTPITLVDVTATDLHRTYPLNAALVSGGDSVQSVGDLHLPDEARLITDVPAGGATLTMPIQGWSHTNVAGDSGAGVDPVYWPYGDMAMEKLWKDGVKDSTEGAYLRWPTESDLNLLGATSDWGTTEGNGVAVGDNRAGLYTFEMASSYGGAPVSGFKRTDIKTAFPWLTVPDSTKIAGDPETWPLEDATRRIVWNGSKKDGEKKLEDKNNYQVTYIDTTTNFDTFPKLFLPDLTLRVQKRVAGGLQDLPETTVFRIKLPDGVELGIGPVGGVTLDDWFATATGNSGNYEASRQGISEAGTTHYIFDLKMNPGDSSAGDYKAQRERLLRYINLGGWFSVSINEDPNTYYWSDFISVYVPPRKNVYLEDKIYNFVGENAALYSFVNVGNTIPTTVTLPAGSYETVDATGRPVYETEKNDQGEVVVTSKRHVERYGVKTLYSGITGAQFGELNTFTIEPDTWTKTTTGEVAGITRYGADEFKHDGYYGAYNWVHDPGIELIEVEENTYTHNENRYYEATIRTQQELKAPQEEKIKLIYNGPPGGVTPYYDATVPVASRQDVELVTFDTRVEGYTVRQEYTLTIVNIGDTDINGLSIDMLTDVLPENTRYKTGGNFTLLKPPAAFLPAGESTTFTLSYQYDLRGVTGGGLEYLDKLFITSDSKHTVGANTTEGVDYLLDFDAQFTVTKDDIHRVWVEYNPADGTMGTAQVIVGDVGTNALNSSAGSSAASQNQTVYVMATPTDEYEVQAYTARASNGAPITLTPYIGKVTLSDGTVVDVDEFSQIRVWYLVMPDYDVTVTIDFYEPISSKLRLSHLTTYADKDKYKLVDGNDDPLPVKDREPYEYVVWQKSFTSTEISNSKNAANYPADSSRPASGPTENEQGRYLMSRGTAVKKGFSDAVDQYLVVIPYEADYAQVEATLREVLNPADGSGNLPEGNGDRIEVQMTLFPHDPIQDPLPPSQAEQIYLGNGNTSVPTVHTSRAFDSPTPGSSNYVQVQITYTSTSGTVTRYYYVEIHRKPQTPEATLKYGNSPYGMIMNADNIAAGDKAAAKTAFVNNRYSFSGLDTSLVPAAVTRNNVKDLHYWTEAWVAVDAAYEPESHMGYLHSQNANGTWTWYPDPNIYKVEDNLDLNDYAFFAILGEDFVDPGLTQVIDSSGRPARIDRAVLSLEVYTLDTDATTQTERFALPADPQSATLDSTEQAALAERTILLSRHTAAGSRVHDWSALENTGGNYLRPGRYRLVYTMPDFDYYDDYNGVTLPNNWDPEGGSTLQVTRDFVVLAPVGDVNSDMPSGKANADDKVADVTDEQLMKGRVTEPLGYMADNYPDGAIFKFRTCDVNNDRNINNIDANAIRVTDLTKGESAVNFVIRYYLPTDYK